MSLKNISAALKEAAITKTEVHVADLPLFDAKFTIASQLTHEKAAKSGDGEVGTETILARVLISPADGSAWIANSRTEVTAIIEALKQASDRAWPGSR